MKCVVNREKDCFMTTNSFSFCSKCLVATHKDVQTTKVTVVDEKAGNSFDPFYVEGEQMLDIMFNEKLILRLDFRTLNDLVVTLTDPSFIPEDINPLWIQRV